MKDLLASLGKFLLDALKKLDWKTVLFHFFKNTILPHLKTKVDSTASKVDDVIYAGVERMVDTFLAPTASGSVEAPKIALEGASI